eukprot:TRINITY_DN3819_c0_g2_i2.p1 TRINITY_DN3819_c0_g2~~TRINITY_DN3819_c0_g2_i2.p1  ORF type:complete len:107 (+),score=10.62 TRINITY_DN3819_c0_g2_i2:327-647(+)
MKPSHSQTPPSCWPGSRAAEALLETTCHYSLHAQRRYPALSADAPTETNSSSPCNFQTLNQTGKKRKVQCIKKSFSDSSPPTLYKCNILVFQTIHMIGLNANGSWG